MSNKRKTTKKSAAKRAAARKSSKSAAKPKGAPKRTARAALAVATSARRPTEERIEALYEVPYFVGETEANLESVLGVLRNKEEPVEVRLTALQTLQAATFASPDYESWRGDYIAALREVATDPDAELRQRALGILARERDGFAQKKLIEGLESPEKALVAPEKALQLLSYDVHTDAYSAARNIIKEPPNTAAKREALRLLAGDATAAPLLEKVVRDKDEALEVREMAAGALHTTQPDKLQKLAREMLLDESEPDEIRTASLMALTQFGDPEQVAQDETLLKHVDKLGEKAPKLMKQTARRFLSKYKR